MVGTQNYLFDKIAYDRTKHMHISHTSTKEEIRIRSMDCYQCQYPGCDTVLQSVKCYHWGNWVKGKM